MARGDFDSLLSNEGYVNSEKRWFVELLRADIFWYELIVNGHDQLESRKAIEHSLKDLKTLVANQLDKRFIYFIASRKKIRFSTKKKPRYSLLSKTLHLYIEEGIDRKCRRVSIDIRNIETGNKINPKVETTDRFITFTDLNGNKVTYSIHDFFIHVGVNFGYATQVHYVGYTSNPHQRPIGGNHSGLTDTLYRTSNGDRDIFIVYNLFKVTVSGVNRVHNIAFHIANSMIDEIKCDQEGLILEKCLILYFASGDQTKNRENERTELENSLLVLSNEHNISSVTISYEMEEPNEYFCFGSSSIPPKDSHLYTFRMDGGQLTREEGDAKYHSFFDI